MTTERQQHLAEIARLDALVAELRDALAATRAEARDGFQRRLDAAEAAMIQVLDDALAGPAHVEPPSDMSAEFARVVRAVRLNVIMRERAKDAQDRLRAEVDVLRQEIRERERAAEVSAKLLTDQRDEARAERDAVLRDARRYWRLRVLGCAPSNSMHLERGTVLCFSNLDKHVDADIDVHPSRGEAELQKAASNG